jgi:polar amino acid transport system substrate-binding protein
MKNLSFVLTIGLILCTVTVFAQEKTIAAEEFTFIIEDDPPLTYVDENGRPTGFLTDLGKTVLEKAGLKIKGEIKPMPAIRADRTVKEQPYALIPYMTRKPSRESTYHWVGPMALREKWFYKLRQRTDIIANTYDELKKYRVGSVIGWSSTDVLVEQGFNVDLAQDDILHWKKFLKGRVDIIQARDDEIAFWTKKLNIRTKIDKLFLFDAKYMYYMAVNKKTPIELVNRMQKALDTMKMNGEYEKIRRRYYLE